MKNITLALAAVLVAGVAGCNGGSSSVPGVGTNNGYIRFVNGSADAGAVDVYVDGNLTASDTDLTYGKITAYQQFKTGTHTVKVVQTGTQNVIGSLSAASVGINGASYYSVVLSGELHPTAGTNAPALITFSDQVFSTGTNQAEVNFHNAATALNTTEQFGYVGTTNAAITGTLGSPVAVGIETGPQGIPANVAGAAAIAFYAGTAAGVTTTPSNLSTQCGTNIMPCDSGSLSLYFIDGPAASTQPVSAPYPQGITASETAGFVGIFDANGT